MAAVRVQTATAATSTTNSPSITLTGTTAGNVLVAGLQFSSDTRTITANTMTGETVNAIGTGANALAGLGTALKLFYIVLGSSGSKTLSISLSTGGTSNNSIWMHEYSGLSGSLDGTETRISGSSQTATGTLTTSSANSLIVGFMNAGQTDSASAWTAAGSGTQVTLPNIDFWTQGWELLDAGAAGSKTVGFDIGFPGNAYGGNFVAFSITATAASSPKFAGKLGGKFAGKVV